MTVYIIELVLIVLLALVLNIFSKEKKETNKKIFLGFCFISLSLIAGFRTYEVGADTSQFVSAFRSINSVINTITVSNLSLYRYEWGFTTLCWLLGRVSTNYTILLLCTSIFINFSVMRFIYKNSDNVYISVLIYFFGGFFFDYMNIMRQALAIAIILFGYEFLKENKKIKFIVSVLLASLFHSSAIICLVMIFIPKIKINKKSIYIILLLTIFAFIFGNTIFDIFANISTRFANYRDSEYYVSNYFGAVIEFAVALFVFLFCTLLTNKEEKINDKNKLIILFLAFGMIFRILTIRINIFYRFAKYFTIFGIIGIPNAISVINNSKDKALWSMMVVGAYVAYWLLIMILRPEWTATNPYSSVLFSIVWR